MTIKAAIDVGTNTVRLLVADGGSPAHAIERQIEITRLGEGVDARKRLQREPLRRTVDVIARYATHARDLGAGRIRIAATSAVRDAANRGDFVAAVRGATGITPEILAGEQEAATSFAGAAAALPGDGAKLVLDIGGGSTETIAGDTQVRAAISVDVGCVRLTERHVSTDPPSVADQAAVRADAASALAHAAVAVRPALPDRFAMIGVAGTCTTIGALALGLDKYDPAKVHHSTVSRERVAFIRDELARMTIAQRKDIDVITPGRADVIVAGAIVLEESMDAFGAREILISEADILDGLVRTLS